MVQLNDIAMNLMIVNMEIRKPKRNFGLLTVAVLIKLNCEVLSEKYIKNVLTGRR